MDMHYYLVGHGFMDGTKEISIPASCTVMTYVEENIQHSGAFTRLIAMDMIIAGKEKKYYLNKEEDSNYITDQTYKPQLPISNKQMKEHYFVGDNDTWSDMYYGEIRVGIITQERLNPIKYPNDYQFACIKNFSNCVKMSALYADGTVKEVGNTAQAVLSCEPGSKPPVFKLFEINDEKCFLTINDNTIVYTLSYILKVLLAKHEKEQNGNEIDKIVLHWTACRSHAGGSFQEAIEFWKNCGEEAYCFKITSICDTKAQYNFNMTKGTDGNWVVNSTKEISHTTPPSPDQAQIAEFPNTAQTLEEVSKTS